VERTLSPLGLLGGGAIATGLAACGLDHGNDVILWARSAAKHDEIQRAVDDLRQREAPRHASLVVTSDLVHLREAPTVVEAIAEDVAVKTTVLRELHRLAPLTRKSLVATTTSSLPLDVLAASLPQGTTFGALHVFNPVPKMPLAEISHLPGAPARVADRLKALAEALGKTPVLVPPLPGFIVNRLLFRFLFDAVRLGVDSGTSPDIVDQCIVGGASHPLGPHRLLDLIGLDVAVAIAESLGLDPTDRVRELVRAGLLGRKAKAGFFEYR